MFRCDCVVICTIDGSIRQFHALLDFHSAPILVRLLFIYPPLRQLTVTSLTIKLVKAVLAVWFNRYVRNFSLCIPRWHCPLSRVHLPLWIGHRLEVAVWMNQFIMIGRDDNYSYIIGVWSDLTAYPTITLERMFTFTIRILLVCEAHGQAHMLPCTVILWELFHVSVIKAVAV